MKPVIKDNLTVIVISDRDATRKLSGEISKSFTLRAQTDEVHEKERYKYDVKNNVEEEQK
jgi:uncharacterized membrane protein